MSLATTNGILRPTNKGHLKAILTAADGICNKKLPQSDLPTCTIIDGMPLVQRIGKPKDLCEVYYKAVHSNFRYSK